MQAASDQLYRSVYLPLFFGGTHSPSVVDTDFTPIELLCLLFGNGAQRTPPTESEAHAVTVGCIVVVEVTRSVDIAEVGSVADIRRTQPHAAQKT